MLEGIDWPYGRIPATLSDRLAQAEFSFPEFGVIVSIRPVPPTGQGDGLQ
jgi:hypothetical protein